MASTSSLRVVLSCPDHPVYEEMVSELSNEISYQVVGPRFRDRGGVNGSRLRLQNRIAHLMRSSSIGAIAYQRAKDGLLARHRDPANLIHCCGHLVYEDHPWIGDYENVNVLGFYSPRLLRSRFFIEHLRNRFLSPACKAIRVWSPSAEQSFRSLFQDEQINNKLRVIYPTMGFPPEALEPRQACGVPRILFVGRGFWIKGGSLFLSALLKLREKVEFRADFICDLPPECDHYREALSGIVNFYEPNFTRRQLYQRFYRNADIFVMLGMADSYGLALLEASAFGLPIVALRLNSGLSDLLSLSGNGVQVETDCQIFDSSGVHCMEPSELVRRAREDDHSDLVARIAAALGGLVSDSNRRQELGKRGRDAVQYGALSPAHMRKNLLELYAQATD